MAKPKKEEGAKKTNPEVIAIKFQESGYTKSDINTMLKHANGWFNDLTTVSRLISIDDLKSLAALFRCKVEDLILEEPPKKPEKQKASSKQAKESKPNEDSLEKLLEGPINFEDFQKELKSLNAIVKMLLLEVKALRADDEEIITGSKADKAAAILLRMLAARNGNSVKMAEFHKYLKKAGIPTSYVTEAISKAGCRKVQGNDDAEYIEHDTFDALKIV